MEGWGSVVQMEGGLGARPAEKVDHRIAIPDWSEESNAPWALPRPAVVCHGLHQLIYQ
jgi:hypothetical protein